MQEKGQSEIHWEGNDKKGSIELIELLLENYPAETKVL
jgi:hypothetical protein